MNLSVLSNRLLNLANPLSEASEEELFDPDWESDVPSASHEIRVLKAKNGSMRWFSKGSAGDDLQLVNEYISWLIYRAFKMNVAPDAKLVKDKSGNVRIATAQVGGKQVKNPDIELKGTDFKDGLFVDAMLGNWDVVGNAPRFNVFVDKESGQTYRIDTGGLDFRAMGGRKGAMFGPEVKELGTFAGIGGKALSDSAAARQFANMRDTDYQRAAKVFRRASWPKIAGVFNQAIRDVDSLGDSELTRAARQYAAKMEPIMKARFEQVSELLISMGLV